MKHFDDLTKIDCPFGELDDDTKTRLVVAVLVDGKQTEHGSLPLFLPTLTYRLKPEPEIPDYINWDHVHPDYNYMARDEKGEKYLFMNFPREVHGEWVDPNNEWLGAPCFSSYKQGNLPWDKSLIERPNRK